MIFLTWLFVFYFGLWQQIFIRYEIVNLNSGSLKLREVDSGTVTLNRAGFLFAASLRSRIDLLKYFVQAAVPDVAYSSTMFKNKNMILFFNVIFKTPVGRL